jgi:hypothetical protein
MENYNQAANGVNIFIDYNDPGFWRGTGGWDLFSYQMSCQMDRTCRQFV